MLSTVTMAIDLLARDFLARLNAVVRKRVTVVLIGGNALTFLGLKKVTEDVDLVCRSTEPVVGNFCRDYRKQYSVKVEFFIDGLFKNIRIKDYLKNAYLIEQKEFPNIELKILNIYDIILTKINRSLPRDFNDIELALSLVDVSEKELDKRFKYLFKFTMGDKQDFADNYDKFKSLFGRLLKP